MNVERFLGAGWASVHGPSDARSLLLWTLENGFRGLLPSPSPRPVDWRRGRARMGNVPVRFCAVRVSAIQDVETPLEHGLVATREQEHLQGMAVVRSALELALDLGTATLLLDPGPVPVRGEVRSADLTDRNVGWTAETAGAMWSRRQMALDAPLDQLCRSLHQLCREFPDAWFCLTLSRNVLGLGAPAELRLVLEDLRRYRVAYWHDTVAAACRQRLLGEDPGEVLESCSKFMRGMTLGDHGDDGAYLPPGAGGVDYPLLSSYRQPSHAGFPVAIELDPGVDPGELPGIHAYLDKIGL